jgi:hypothetical protein
MVSHRQIEIDDTSAESRNFRLGVGEVAADQQTVPQET